MLQAAPIGDSLGFFAWKVGDLSQGASEIPFQGHSLGRSRRVLTRRRLHRFRRSGAGYRIEVEYDLQGGVAGL